jgi:hypothetical protein
MDSKGTLNNPAGFDPDATLLYGLLAQAFHVIDR